MKSCPPCNGNCLQGRGCDADEPHPGDGLIVVLLWAAGLAAIVGAGMTLWRAWPWF